jgi:hypothetical protein
MAEAQKGYQISQDKGKAQQDMRGKGPGAVRGKEFGAQKMGPKQGDTKGQPKQPWGKGKMGGMKAEGNQPHEGDGDAQ